MIKCPSTVVKIVSKRATKITPYFCSHVCYMCIHKRYGHIINNIVLHHPMESLFTNSLLQNGSNAEEMYKNLSLGKKKSNFVQS